MHKQKFTLPYFGITLLLSFVTMATWASSATCAFDVLPDSASYSAHPYVRFLSDGEQLPDLTDEAFYDIAAQVIFPVGKSDLPTNDSLITRLQREVFPLINRDSLELASMMIRGAASPEGSYSFNKVLGEQRAQTLVQFLRDHIAMPIDDGAFHMDIDIEDYRTLCIMMRRAADKDYAEVQALCDRHLPQGHVQQLKRDLQAAHGGHLWQRLLNGYFPRLRAARVVFFFRTPRTRAKVIVPEVTTAGVMPVLTDTLPTPTPLVEVTEAVADVDATEEVRLRVPRREFLAVKSNLLFDVAYVPGYDRWCPIPNVAIEYYPQRGHFTFGASLDLPWWQHYDAHKYFQIRNWQVETRYYLRSGDIDRRPLGEGAAFRGWYLQAYLHAGVFGICFDANRGWVGEGGGGGIGAGYVMQLSRPSRRGISTAYGHWRLEFGIQVGYFRCKYDPYKYENPVNPAYHDDLYYYKWTGKPEFFRKRQYRYSWFGPTRVSITLVYDLLYRRNTKNGVSFKSWETHTTHKPHETHETHEAHETHKPHALCCLLLLLTLLFPLQARAQITIGGNVYGGGEHGKVEGNGHVTIQDGTIKGDVYGGGNLGDLDGKTTVTLRGGDLNGVFGGARMANIGKYAYVNVDGTWTVNFYDDAEEPSKVTSTVTVPAHTKGKIGAIGTVFGGGNAAKVEGNTNVNIGNQADNYITKTVAEGEDVTSYYTCTDSGTFVEATGTAVAGTTYYEKKTVVGVDIRDNVYGGGNAADVTGDTNVVVGK